MKYIVYLLTAIKRYSHVTPLILPNYVALYKSHYCYYYYYYYYYYWKIL